MNIRLPEDLAAELREYARTHGRSQQDVVRAAVGQYLRSGGRAPANTWLAQHLIRNDTPFMQLADEELIAPAPKSDAVDLIRAQRGER